MLKQKPKILKKEIKPERKVSQDGKKENSVKEETSVKEKSMLRVLTRPEKLDMKIKEGWKLVENQGDLLLIEKEI